MPFLPLSLRLPPTPPHLSAQACPPHPTPPRRRGLVCSKRNLLAHRDVADGETLGKLPPSLSCCFFTC